MELIACARMYNVTDRARMAWRELFVWLQSESGVALQIIDHTAPATLDELWSRSDLGCAFMCGWPYFRSYADHQWIAAPVPAAQRYQSRPQYFTDLIVRRDRGFQSLADTFGGKIGWTVPHSHSGYNAPRHHLLNFRRDNLPQLYRQSIGPLVSPTGCLQRVIDGDVDIAPMDSYALDLISLHNPERTADIEVIETTEPAPIPLLVASPQIDRSVVARLRSALLCAGQSDSIRHCLNILNLRGFAAVNRADYALGDIWHQKAVDSGYQVIG